MKFLKIKDESHFRVKGEPAGNEIIYINVNHIACITNTMDGKKRQLHLNNGKTINTSLTVESLIQKITSETN